jgi:hypothetical protein
MLSESCSDQRRAVSPQFAGQYRNQRRSLGDAVQLSATTFIASSLQQFLFALVIAIISECISSAFRTYPSYFTAHYVSYILINPFGNIQIK